VYGQPYRGFESLSLRQVMCLGAVYQPNHPKWQQANMQISELSKLVHEIVEQATALKNKHVNEPDAPVNYACVFAQSEIEYESLLDAAHEMGEVIMETPSGLLFRIEPMATAAGPLQLLKIRKPDPIRPERGDADFTIDDFEAFERDYLDLPNFSRMEKPTFYMIELTDPAFNVRAYFSNPPLDQQLGIKPS
jgi:hypothetical protein